MICHRTHAVLKQGESLLTMVDSVLGCYEGSNNNWALSSKLYFNQRYEGQVNDCEFVGYLIVLTDMEGGFITTIPNK